MRLHWTHTEKNVNYMINLEKDLLKLVPYGLLVTRPWLLSQGVERYMIDNWLRRKELVSLTTGVFTRPDLRKLTWQGIVCSMQRMKMALTPGGLTALDLQGYGHYLQLSSNDSIHLYGSDPLPGWINKILPGTTFIRHSDHKLFAGGLRNDVYDTKADNHQDGDPLKFSNVMAWGIDEWPLTISTLERAFFEVLLDVPEHVTFEHADQLIQGLTSLSPRRVNRLLERCTNVKVKRLFLWFSEKHQHPWFKKLELEKFTFQNGSLGSGKRMLIKGGKLDTKYLITVPEELHESR
jgi:Transcriptional regulator, AbiEi antitoxin, Type IV TA system/Transcriptional regulator, AbiEi antitoxin N-terminal domain